MPFLFEHNPTTYVGLLDLIKVDILTKEKYNEIPQVLKVQKYQCFWVDLTEMKRAIKAKVS